MIMTLPSSQVSDRVAITCSLAVALAMDRASSSYPTGGFEQLVKTRKIAAIFAPKRGASIGRPRAPFSAVDGAAGIDMSLPPTAWFRSHGAASLFSGGKGTLLRQKLGNQACMKNKFAGPRRRVGGQGRSAGENTRPRLTVMGANAHAAVLNRRSGI